MNAQNIRTYDDRGNMWGANHVDGVENKDKPDSVIYAWAFIDGRLSMSVWIGEEQFSFE